MAITLLCGFESGAILSDFVTVGANVSYDASLKRTGSYSLKVSWSNTNANADATTFSRAAGGSSRLLFQSVRVYLYITTLPTSALGNYTKLIQIGNGSVAAGTVLHLSSDGKLTIADGANGNQITSSSTLTTGQWYKISIDANGTARTVYVDDVQFAVTTGVTSAAAQTGITIGFSIAASQFSSVNLNYDDLLVDNGAFGNSGPSGNCLLLVPTADPVSLNSWTNGGGGTTSIFEGVNNIPPTGDVPATNGIKIKNAANGGNLDYVATMQTYTAAGVPSDATVNAVMAICNDGEEVATNTKAGGIWIASNPAQSAGGNSFDYGDDAGAYGAFPGNNWKTHYGPVASSPSVTLGTAPTVTLRKTSSTTRVVAVDFIGLYVDYTPASAYTPVSPFNTQGFFGI